MLLATTYCSLSVPKMPGMGKMLSEEWKGQTSSLFTSCYCVALASLGCQPISVMLCLVLSDSGTGEQLRVGTLMALFRHDWWNFAEHGTSTSSS